MGNHKILNTTGGWKQKKKIIPKGCYQQEHNIIDANTEAKIVLK